MWEMIRGYLTFTRKERLGVLFLLILILVLFVLPYFFGPAIGDPDPAAYEKMKTAIRKFETDHPDSARYSVKHDRYSDPDENKPGEKEPYSKGSANTALFYFDPNKLNADGWKQLGISGRLSQTILHYIEKGGRFRKADDLKKLYGLRNSDYKRISPYVRINNGAEVNSVYKSLPGKKLDSLFNASSTYRASSRDSSSANYSRKNAGSEWIYHSKKLVPTDINLADSTVWSRLPGIGLKLAVRIVHFRDKLGGFYAIEQVGETFGLPDSVFQKIKPILRLDGAPLSQLDLNNATKEILQAHPYIRRQIASEIIAYRHQHGNFHAVEELLQLAQMSQGRFEKLKPYLKIAP